MPTLNNQSDMLEPESEQILLIGLGQWGITWIDVIKGSPYYEAVGYVDKDESRLKAASKRKAISLSECYTDMAAAIAETNATAIVCAVPPAAHRTVAETALDRGLHVLTEKPLAETLENAKGMIEAAEVADRKLMVSQNYRFDAASRMMRDVLNREFVGEIGYVKVRYDRKLDSSVTSDFRLQMQYPLLRDMAIHHFDQMRYVLDLNPVAVRAQSMNPPWSEFDHAPVSSVIFEMEDGVMVDYFGSHVSQGKATTWNGDWNISCGGTEIEWKDGKISLLTQNPVHSVEQEGMVEKTLPGSADKGVLEVEPIPMKHESRDYSLYEFHQAIKEDREPETSARSNSNTLAMVRAAIESCERNDRVSIEEFINLDHS